MAQHNPASRVIPYHRLFQRLLGAYGPQHWWPGETRIEIMVGAVLTQNTAWRNVERAIDRLKAAAVLETRAIAGLPPEELADLIRPAGYFNVKARRLQSLCNFLLESGGIAALERLSTDVLRSRLLAVHGVGPETADDILLYAFERPVFVVDAYTRRLGGRLGLLAGGEGYEEIRHSFETAIGLDTRTFNELHALIVHHAKYFCRKRPLCEECCLADHCPGTVTDRYSTAVPATGP
jgi:endonuclease-3 related protein